jgi:hypothetical protein
MVAARLLLDAWVGDAARDVDTGILDHASRYDASRIFLSANATGRYGPLISGQSRTLTFSLLEATEVYHVPLAALDEIERTAPENARAIHAISDFGVAVSMSVVGTLQLRDSDRRIAATLLRVAPPVEDLEPGAPHEVLLTQTQLGEFAARSGANA